MAIIIDGKKIRDEILLDIKKEVSFLPFKPVFCDILVGEDAVSAQYVQMKKQRAETVGMQFHSANFLATISTEDLIKEIKVLNKIPNMCGIIIQLPLPESIDRRAVLDAIEPHLDVDCLGSVTGGQFYRGEIKLGFPTALACMTLLDSLKLNLNDKRIVVLGYGDLVGKPVAALLEFRGIKPEIIRSKTENKEEIIKNADIVISGIGQGRYITGDMIKRGVILIDAGTSEASNSIVGDVDFESVKDIAGFVSPVPGGVGPVTVAMLLNNVLQVAKSNMIL